HLEQSSSYNFNKFLDGVPQLEKLIGHIYFTKVGLRQFTFIFLLYSFFVLLGSGSFQQSGFSCSPVSDFFFAVAGRYSWHLALGGGLWTGRELQSRSRRLASWSAGCAAGDSAAGRHSTAEIEAKKGEGFGFVLICYLNEYGLTGNLE
ncbi:Hypothetical predicted protein, partial [Olea europaea subsp. europaea]